MQRGEASGMLGQARVQVALGARRAGRLRQRRVRAAPAARGRRRAARGERARRAEPHQRLC